MIPVAIALAAFAAWLLCTAAILSFLAINKVGANDAQ